MPPKAEARSTTPTVVLAPELATAALPPFPTEPKGPQEPPEPAVGLAVGSSTHVPLAEAGGTFLGRLEVAEVAGAPVELGSEGLTTGHGTTLDPRHLFDALSVPLARPDASLPATATPRSPSPGPTEHNQQG